LIGLAAAPLVGCKTAETETPSLAVVDNAADSFASLPNESEQVSAAELTNRNPELARQLVPYKGTERSGTIIVRTNERRLYLVLGDGKAIRYPVGVGRDGKRWQGRAEVDGKHVEPAWSPPEEIKHDNPRLPERDPRRFAGQSNGPARAHPFWRRAICHPWHEPAEHGGHLRELWLHSHVQRGHPRLV
jgi:lipoprotein-anchoring transpeptidase ErfK/SrfK